MQSYTKKYWPADGPVRALLEYLDALHREAGRPSMPEIGREVALARNTVYDFFTARRAISAGNLELLVNCLDGDAAKAERLRKAASSARAERSRTAVVVTRHDPGDVDRPWMVPPLERETIRRAGLVAALTALLSGESAPVVGVHGPGGFGKTTLVADVCREQGIAAVFPGGLLWVTLGRSVTDGQLAAKAGDLAFQITGERPLLTDPQQAGFHLGRVLDARRNRTLIVVDDVWLGRHLRPFLTGGRFCVRIVTTRNQRILPPEHVIRVKHMTPDEASRLLTRGTPPIERTVLDELAELAHGWPVLLDLTNRALHRTLRSVRDPAEATEAVRHIATRLASIGPAALDPVGAISDDDRHEAVAATVGVGLDMLPADIRPLYRQLAVFAPDALISLKVLELLWGPTGEIEQICEELFDLSMVASYSRSPQAIQIHGVLRAYLRQMAGRDQLATDNEKLLTNAAGLVGLSREYNAAWWRLTDDVAYLRDHLIDHLLTAGRHAESRSLVTDLRWAEMRLRNGGPAGLESDLDTVLSGGADKTTAALRRCLSQAAHLLGPLEPEWALGAVLASRFDGDAHLTQIIERYLKDLPHPRLVNRAQLPDKPHPSQIRTLVGHRGEVNAVAIAPNGEWLATAGEDATVRLWHRRSGSEAAVCAGHADRVNAVAISPDGSWFASAGDDRQMRVWNAGDGTPRKALTLEGITVSALAVTPDGASLLTAGGADGDEHPNLHLHEIAIDAAESALGRYEGWTYAAAISPDGTWVATAGASGTIRITSLGGDATTPGFDAEHRGWINSVAISSDGAWLASAGADATIRLWARDGGAPTAVLNGHTGAVNSVAISPNAQWLASGGADGTVRIWDREHEKLMMILTGHVGAVKAIAIAPDGTWLASVGVDQTARLWSVDLPAGATSALDPEPSAFHAAAFTRDGRLLALASDDGAIRVRHPDGGDDVAVETGHRGPVRAVAFAPHGRWVATGGVDSTVRIASTSNGRPPTVLNGHTGPVDAVAVAPDGTWLASAGSDGAVRRWSATGETRSTLLGPTDWILGLAIAPDGTWLACASADGTIRIWDHMDAETVLAGHEAAVNAVAVSPDGSWLASAGADGTVRLWSRTDQLAALTGHTAAVNSVAISPDGNWVASAGADRTLRVWARSKPDPVAAMRVAGRLHGCLWRPASHDLFAIGDAGVYTFAFQPAVR